MAQQVVSFIGNATPALGMADLEIGASYTGAQQYYDIINAQMIGKTNEILGKFQTEVLNVVSKGWVGASYQKFATDMQNRVTEIQKELELEGKALKDKLQKIAGAYLSIDESLYGKVSSASPSKN